MNDNVSFYQGVSPKPDCEVTWQSCLVAIKDGMYRESIEIARTIEDVDEYREYKKKLPAVTFSGTFNGRRARTNVIDATGFITADLDHIENVDEIFDIVCQDERTWYAFRSPSGDGIKIGLRAKGISTDDDIKVFFSAIHSYFKESYGIEIDPACKDISRLTFLSFDNDAFVNESPVYFSIESWLEKQDEKPAQASREGIDFTHTSGHEKYALRVLEGCCAEIANSPKGAQHYTRLKRSRLIGGYLNYISEQLVYSELEKAVTASGAKNIDAAMLTIRHGLEYGRKEPIEIPSLLTKSTKLTKSTSVDNSDINRHSLTEVDGALTEVDKVDSGGEWIPRRFMGNLSAEIDGFIKGNQGSFTTAEIDREFGLTSRADKQCRYAALSRACKKKTLRKDKRVTGKYHILTEEIEWIDLDAVDEAPFPLTLPLGLTDMVNIPHKCICVLAGTSNAGKTAFLLETLRLNLEAGYNRLYLMSEMGPSEYKKRISLLGTDKKQWKKSVLSASISSGFDGTIGNHNPNGLTVVDFLEEVEGEYFRIASDLRSIYDSLDTGVAFVGLQKHSKASVGRGGEGTTEKARLYLTMDMLLHQPQCTISAVKIIKAKDYDCDNPNGKEIHVKVIRGGSFEVLSDWMYCNEKQREQYIQRYEHMFQAGLDEPVTGERAVAYRFMLEDGGYGNLRENDLKRWRKSFPEMDVDYELQSIAEWTHKKPLKRKSWFMHISIMLKKKHTNG